MGKRVKRVRGTLQAITMLLTVGAIVQQLRRPKTERTWHGTIARVPYDLRRPTWARVRQAMWNPNTNALFVPHAFGVGWTINLHRLTHLFRRPAR